MHDKETMKVGDLVIPLDPEKALEPNTSSVKYLNEHKSAGVILKVLNGGSHRKQSSYEDYWAHTGMTSWHTLCSLTLLSP